MNRAFPEELACFRIRLHGRGGQGIKTGARVLGSAFFLSGYEVQDAPLYGAERRGAPIYAFVRASRRPIQERGVIRRPDLVAVADAGLLEACPAAVLDGVDAKTTLVLCTQLAGPVLAERYELRCPVLGLPNAIAPGVRARSLGIVCAGAAARLVGVIDRPTLEAAVVAELSDLGADAISAALAQALAAYDVFEARAGQVAPSAPHEFTVARAEPWIEVPNDPIAASTPAIFVARSSERVRTGLWRTERPIVDRERCHRCAWVCSTACPDGVIGADERGYPRIDLDHCKGCMICLQQCPWHAIDSMSEAGNE